MDTLHTVILGGTCYASIKSRTKVVEKNEKMSNSLFLCVLEFTR